MYCQGVGHNLSRGPKQEGPDGCKCEQHLIELIRQRRTDPGYRTSPPRRSTSVIRHVLNILGHRYTSMCRPILIVSFIKPCGQTCVEIGPIYGWRQRADVIAD